jgi:hypothetical protein
LALPRRYVIGVDATAATPRQRVTEPETDSLIKIAD